MFSCFFFQAEDGIRDLVRSRGLGDVYKRQALILPTEARPRFSDPFFSEFVAGVVDQAAQHQFDLSLIHI